jgi:hypothetical protein
MLFDVWDLYQQGQIDSVTETPGAAKRDGAQNADRVQREVLRLESKIDRLALISQALWELLREKTSLSDQDIETKMTEIDLRDGRKDGRITGTVTICPKCARPAHTRDRVCPYCGAAIDRGHIVEKR